MAYFIRPIPALMSVSTLMCIITDERNLGSTIMIEWPRRIQKSELIMKEHRRKTRVDWKKMTISAPKYRLEISRVFIDVGGQQLVTDRSRRL